LPFCHLTLKSKKPYNPKYLADPMTLGDHLWNGRLVRRLDRKSVANLLGIWAWTYSLWEKDRAEPKIWNMRKIVEFLGTCPIDPEDTPGRRLARARQCLGLGQKRLARMVGIDPNTVWRLETLPWDGRESYLEEVVRFLEMEAVRQANRTA
jgi:DNA-binding XRE family transcriptional regulator